MALDKRQFISPGLEKALGMAAACVLAIRPLLLVKLSAAGARRLAATGWMEECSSIG